MFRQKFGYQELDAEGHLVNDSRELTPIELNEKIRILQEEVAFLKDNQNNIATSIRDLLETQDRMLDLINKSFECAKHLSDATILLAK